MRNVVPAAPADLVLASRYLTAGFDPATGNLRSLAPARGRGRGGSIVKAACCRFHLGERVICELTPGDFKTVKVRATQSRVESVVCAEDVEVTRRFELEPDSPLLKATYSVRSIGRAVEIARVAFPRIEWADDFCNAFVDPNDLYFDGAELGGGKELPCWRVLFRKGHRDGAILATRSRLDMSRLQVWDRSVEFKPHVMTAYDTDYTLWVKPMTLSGSKRYSVSFEIGPWRASQHRSILRGAKLNTPTAVKAPPASGTQPGGRLKGKVFAAVKLASPSAADQTYHPKKWRTVRLPWTRQAKVLFADAGVRPPALKLNPNLRGVYRMFVGVGNGVGVTIRMTSEPEPIYRLNKPLGAGSHRTPFHPSLSGRHRAVELSCGTYEMAGRTITLEPLGNPHLHTMLDYVRFEKLTPAQAGVWRRRMAKRPRIELSGFADVQSLAHMGDNRKPGPEPYRANIAAHARCGFSSICWRIDGQCSDFPSRHNTMRYVSAKVHGVFSPQSKAYGRALRRFDMLRMAVEAGRKYGVGIYGWMRFNNYSGNVQSDFFRDNPRFHEEWEHGAKAEKLCLAFEEVRRHKINILVEAAGYGLAGLSLGFLRHPPILLYHPVLVAGYRKEYGVDPPRIRDAADPIHLTSLPEQDEDHVRWYRYRARFMTTFMRDLRAELRAKNLGHVKIGIWVRPNHCLFDGIDLDTWLDEGLCDEVVAGATVSWFMTPDVGMASPAWVAKVRSRAKLMLNIWIADMKWTRQLIDHAIAQGYHGVTTYESNMAVLDDRMIALYDRLRR